MRGAIFDLLYWTGISVFSGPYKNLGKRLYAMGTKLQGENASEDRLVPSLRNLSYGGSQPSIEAASFIAPNSTILGKVQVGLNSSVWYGATLIGTKGITIGDNSVVQDRCHLSSDVQIGDGVFIGPNATLQGAHLSNGSFVAMGATVRHAKVETGGLVAAGAVVADNAIVKQGEIWAGSPAKFLRHITPVEREILKQHIQQMRDLAVVHSDEAEKSSREVISGKKQPYEMANFENLVDKMYTDEEVTGEMIVTDQDAQFVERRTFMREYIIPPKTEEDYEPFEYNIGHMGEKFNLGVHKQAYNKVATKLQQKRKFDTDKGSWTKPF